VDLSLLVEFTLTVPPTAAPRLKEAEVESLSTLTELLTPV
jgi:hypothetical protein